MEGDTLDGIFFDAFSIIDTIQFGIFVYVCVCVCACVYLFVFVCMFVFVCEWVCVRVSSMGIVCCFTRVKGAPVSQKRAIVSCRGAFHRNKYLICTWTPRSHIIKSRNPAAYFVYAPDVLSGRNARRKNIYRFHSQKQILCCVVSFELFNSISNRMVWIWYILKWYAKISKT